MVKSIDVPILSKKLIAEDTIEARFDTSSFDFIFTAGQYITVSLPGLENNPITDRYHDFSIASSPNNKEYIAVAFRNSESVFKKKFMSLPAGSLITIEGPKGVLKLPGSTERPLIFLAGGTGITPFLSMMRVVNEDKLKYNITLLYFNSSLDRAAYLNEISDIVRQNPNFLVYNFVGPVTDKHLLPQVNSDLNPLWYVVGPKVFVSKAMAILRKAGVVDTDILFEDYTGYYKYI